MSVRYRNLIVDPHVRRNPRVYRTQAVEADGVWRVTFTESNVWGTFCSGISVSGDPIKYYRDNPCVYYLRYRKSADATISVYRGGKQIATGSDWTAWLVDGTPERNEVNPVLLMEGNTATSWVEPIEHGCYSSSDWKHIKQLYDTGCLASPWFAGDTLSNGGGRPSDALVGYPPCEHWVVAA